MFESDDTPTASGWPPSDLEELNNDSYAPLPVPDGYWQSFSTPPPGYYAILGAAWELGAPSPGDDTIFGWWPSAPSARLSADVALFGGRFDPPLIIPPAGMTLTLAEVQLHLHDCGPLPPPNPPQLADGSFETPVMTSPPPGNWSYNPAGSPWTFSSQSGISGNGSAFTNGNPNAPDGVQVGLLQANNSMSQIAVGDAGTYKLIGFIAAQSGTATPSVDFQVDGTSIDTITTASSSYINYTSPSFTLAAGSHFFFFVGLGGSSPDRTLFMDALTIVPG